MKESVSVARSYIRSIAPELGIETDVFENHDIHIHVPSGAIPKDGPSAGVTMITAITSLLTGLPVAPTVAMTGEITLRGAVLPVGGIKEKVLAAHRAGIKHVLLPKKNQKDLPEIPDEIAAELTFTTVSRMEEVLAVALGEENLQKLRDDLAALIADRFRTASEVYHVRKDAVIVKAHKTNLCARLAWSVCGVVNLAAWRS